MFSKPIQRLQTSSVVLRESRRGFAVNEKQIKMRMKSVKSIEKITKAMKMVAASKMRGELTRLEAGKRFGFNSVDMVFKSDSYLQRKAPVQDMHDSSEYIIPLTSDRGLCGGINSNIVREIKGYVKDKNRSKIRIMPVGEKGSMAMIRPFPDMLKMSISDIGSPCNYPTIMAISDQVMRDSEGYDKIVVYYNEFKSAISQIIRRMELMPRKRFLDTMKFARLYNQKLPDKNTSNPALYELYLTSNLWIAFLNNAASEQSARMNAMENASKNAREIVEKLNLLYNKARQARITMELVEIISGASAL
ncbi:atp synthase gamma [Stylonychia lemnae]|uniref:ATP synthase subunit gamma n=1 Tax=Stylonychia lemnae TaxID=5949 RepID=A0A077ZW62_STYLE|nr:atp synthase gamma [Stylonychia lemnae]|eukprot:CDW74190.1 atp synthase gamma [Stylonychia lemnae]